MPHQFLTLDLVLGLVAIACLTTTPATAAPLTVTGPAHVVDGDTVVVAGTTVRLKGVDAAELGTARGENARRVMVTLVGYIGQSHSTCSGRGCDQSVFLCRHRRRVSCG